MRHEFSDKVKKVLAGRVAYRCSFPGCGRITVGPGHNNNEHVVNLGEAAHIYAASNNGPRANASMTEDELSSIDNGIWMCRTHARFIDSDQINYSAETLVQWKRNAEEITYKNLQELERDYPGNSQTLISLTRSLIFSGTWISVIDDTWVFEIDHFVVGELENLKSLSIDFDNIASWNRYVVIESQGDGRELKAFSWQLGSNRKYNISCKVMAKSPRTDPNKVGGDIAIGDNFDIFFENNDLAIVTGIASAIQSMRIIVSGSFGDFMGNNSLGSDFSRYYFEYGTDVPLFTRLIKLEIIRLISVSTPDTMTKISSPSLDFINRVIEINIIEINEIKNFIIVELKLEWGNGEYWIGNIKFRIQKNYQQNREEEDNDFWGS